MKIIVTINGKETDMKMKAGEDGKVYFEEEIMLDETEKNKQSLLDKNNFSENKVLKLQYIKPDILENEKLG